MAGPNGTGVDPRSADVVVPLSGDVGWIAECYPVEGRHLHVSLYLIRTPAGNIVVDSGSFYRGITWKVWQDGVDLITSEEVWVMTGWEPIVYEARRR